MKRLLAPLAAGIAVALSATVMSVTAGAQIHATKTVQPGIARTLTCKVPTPAVPTVVLSQKGNYIKNTKPAVAGCGWPAGDSIVLAECNGDGATVSDLQGCKIDTTGSAITVSGTGTWAAAAGDIKIGEGPQTTNTLSDCPPTRLQASHGVQCIVGAGDLTNLSKAGFAPISFSVPKLAVTVSKPRIVSGRKHWNVTIREKLAYTPTVFQGYNFGGFLTYGTTSKGSLVCQPSTNGQVWASPGLPLCTVIKGEKVKIKVNGKTIGVVNTDIGKTNAGEFSFVDKNLVAGRYTFVATGELSTDTISVLVHL
jgi:hypothetical protein